MGCPELSVDRAKTQHDAPTAVKVVQEQRRAWEAIAAPRWDRLNPLLNLGPINENPAPGFWPGGRAFTASVSTPTGNGTHLGIAWHPLAGRARRCLPYTDCHSLHCLGSDSQPSPEPSSEHWLECRPGGADKPPFWGEPPKPARSY